MTITFGNEWEMTGSGGVEICASNSPNGGIGIDVLVDGEWQARYFDYTSIPGRSPNEFWDYSTHLTVTP